eukprot:TRINITY_DN15487_c0_g1_i1.p1 TRINITY_DN15487_c0_g1~~TRINITY_DN15487_c0_g1_i1.p1  ORF type:complete len:264 (-),score=15.83 TRINITY_DN15487_c0_g1_i1:48-839(-)
MSRCAWSFWWGSISSTAWFFTGVSAWLSQLVCLTWRVRSAVMGSMQWSARCLHSFAAMVRAVYSLPVLGAGVVAVDIRRIYQLVCKCRVSQVYIGVLSRPSQIVRRGCKARPAVKGSMHRAARCFLSLVTAVRAVYSLPVLCAMLLQSFSHWSVISGFKCGVTLTVNMLFCILIIIVGYQVGVYLRDFRQIKPLVPSMSPCGEGAISSKALVRRQIGLNARAFLKEKPLVPSPSHCGDDSFPSDVPVGRQAGLNAHDKGALPV